LQPGILRNCSLIIGVPERFDTDGLLISTEHSGPRDAPVESRPLAVHFVAVSIIRQGIKLSAVLVLLIPAAARAECAGVTVPLLLNGPYAAPILFRGTVRNVEKPTNQPYEIVTFRVAEIWKGNIGREIALGQMMTAESISFAPEWEYLVVAYDPATATIRPPLPPNMFEISYCASRPIDVAKRRGFLRDLGRGRAAAGK
jgi:hypothetical protein